MLAPVIVFVYNRPIHTQKTLEALALNVVSRGTPLYIYHDGIRTNASLIERESYAQVADLIANFNWPGTKKLVQSQVNRGLADSIINGVTEVAKLHGKVIVLEDDLITAPGFLSYMNDALSTYENDKQVMHISGYLFPMGLNSLPQTFFHTATNSWGWATWADRWQYFNPDANCLYKELAEKGKLNAFNLDGYGKSLSQLGDNMSGQIKTWAVKWEASVFLRGGYCLYPGTSLIRNIGHDDSGVHCSAYNYQLYTFQEVADKIEVVKQPLVYNKAYRNRMKYFIQLNGSVSLFSRLKFDLKRLRYKLKQVLKW